ncbi:hypothetical protein BZG02_13005 [Labilibaculum filiforme]|uniref:Inner membrane protein YgaP-like transmembrane domain-containing protein n=1 Tax=Labilibaculum filiforme TaxID=1940526 RepID=A0A2N3HW19_9BACT|nr:DUF2892 domain-containing protein [Labilibaculum filiforme]PKQ62231.1 hypothetical protein BZG02_13005 [Labilibaculum filiforme]
MKTNMGKIDRLIRIIVGLVLIALYFTDIISGTIGIIALVIAGMFILTSILGNCPPYGLFGINTCKVKEPK